MNKEQLASELVRIAKSLTANRERKAGWGFEIAVQEPEFSNDLEIDWKALADNLKAQNVHADIAQMVKVAVGRQMRQLIRGEPVTVKKDFLIVLRYRHGQLQVLVD